MPSRAPSSVRVEPARSAPTMADAHPRPSSSVSHPAHPPRPRKDHWRVAIVGAGYIADYHLPVLQSLAGVEVVAIVDSFLPRAQALAQRFGIAHAFTELEDLEELAIDVAHLLVPPDLHGRLVRELFDLGIGAYVEKPFVLSSAEARELHALAEARGLVLGVHHNNVFHPAFARLRERVAAGEIGRVEHVQVTWNVPLAQLDAGDYAHWMFRAPRNILFEQAVHPFSQVHALLGPVRRAHACALGERELNPGQLFVDRWAVDVVAERGTAQVYLAFGQGFSRSTLQVIGTDGSLEADLQHDTLCGEKKTPWLEFWNSFLASNGRGKEQKRDARRVLKNYLAFTLGIGKRQDAFWVGMREAITRFYADLAAGTDLPADGAHAAEVLEWCEAAAEAAPAGVSCELRLPDPGAPRPGEIAVLGGTGFIGRRTVAKLLEAGLPVSLIVRRRHSLPAEIVAAAQSGKLRILSGSLEDEDALHKALEGCSTVMQLATGSGDTWEKIEKAMVRGSTRMAELALEHGCKRFVYVSSVAALDTSGTAEIADSLRTDPRAEARPLYSRGKIAAEQALLELQQKRGLPLVIVRPGVVIGAGTPMQHSGYGLWTRDNQCIGWGPGTNPLPLVWVDDVADALVLLARYAKDDLHGQALNLCARTPLDAQRIVAELARHTGRPIHFHPRSLVLSQSMEIGKWVVKKAGRRAGVEFPSWHDLKSRALVAPFTCDLARTKLGWKPVEEPEELLDKAVRVYRRSR